MLLSRRGANVLFVLLMCVCMSASMSLAMTLLNSGLSSGFLWRWGRAFGISTLVAVPVALLIAPPLRKLAEHFCRS
ncbi:MAG: DUF2798 domain-containing protein [Phycisphaerae bacterium]|nr:DUF2798 domain-containing protein [Phycisphaerae bacterium]